MKVLAMLAAAGALALAASANANLIVNGDFSSGTGLVNPYVQVDGASAAQLTGWTVTGGSVDWIGTYWQGTDGGHSLDMSGISRGTITQSFAFPYSGFVTTRLTFDLAGNPDDPVDKVIRVTVGETTYNTSVTQDFTFTQAGGTLGNMGWQPITWDIPAVGPFAAYITFESLGGTSSNSTYPEGFGPAIDNVSFDVVPEPTSLGLLATAGMLLMKRRTKA